MTSRYELTLEPRTIDNAEPKARELLEGAQAQLGRIPNMYARMANSPGLLSTYLHGYQQFRQDSGLSPAEQEVVLLTISRENGCHYCVAAHSVLADNMSGVPTDVTDAIRDGKDIPDRKLAALSNFTRSMVQSRGNPGKADVEAFLAADYTERHVLEIVLAIAVKTISNYANHLFQTPIDDMFASRKWYG